MKTWMSAAIAGVMAVGGWAENVQSSASAPSLKNGVRQLELHRHEHAAAGEVPLDRLPEGGTRWNIPEGLEYGALFEWELSHSAGETDETMATVELGAGWQMTDWLHGDVVFLYEENDTDPMNLDQLYLTIGNTEAFPFYLQAGKFYVPFGHFDSFFISDPVALELGEALEQGATLGFERGGFDAALTVFETDIHGADTRNATLAASYSAERDDLSVAVGGSLIYNILDADGLTGVLVDDLGYTFADESAGANGWVTVSKDRVTLIAELVQTLESLEIDGADTGLKPAALNLELGVAVTDALTLAVKAERAEDVALWFAEERYGAAGSYTLLERDWLTAGVTLEVLREEFADGSDADLFTMQFAVEF